MALSNSTRTWLRSLLSAGIGGAAGSLGAIVIAPADFNLQSAPGVHKVIAMAVWSAVIAVGHYLAQSPLPPIVQEETKVEKRKDSEGNLVSETETNITTKTTPGGL